MGLLRAQLLGEVRLSVDGGEVPIRGRKRSSLVAMLALNANLPVATWTLIQCLDPEGRDRDPANALQAQMSRLRSALEKGAGANGRNLLTTEGPEYRLQVDEMDLWEFRLLVRRARSILASDPLDATRVFRRALSLWNAPLGHLASELEFSGHVMELNFEFLSVEDEWIDACLQVCLSQTGGRCWDTSTRESCESEIDALVCAAQRAPLRETRVAAVSQLLFVVGRQAEALRLIELSRIALRDELGADPGAELSSMWERILRHDETLSDTVQRATSLQRRATAATREFPLEQILNGLEVYGGIATVVGQFGNRATQSVRAWCDAHDGSAKIEWLDLRSIRFEGNRRITDRRLVAEDSNIAVVDAPSTLLPEAAELIRDLRTIRNDLFVIVVSDRPLGILREHVVNLPQA